MLTKVISIFGLWIALTGLSVAGDRDSDAPPPELRERLDKDGFCIAEKCKSMGDVYLDHSGPVFITTDSVLLQYHELLRITISEREIQFSSKIYEDMKRGWKQLGRFSKAKPEADPKVCAAGLRRARIVCGTVISLLDPAWKISDPELARVISDEVKRITDATEKTKPAWLGPSEPTFRAIDYTAYKPTGPLAESEAGCRYFRTIRFLQTVPFRLSRQDELFSACYLLHVIPHYYTVSSQDNVYSDLEELKRFTYSIGPPAFTLLWNVLSDNEENPNIPLHAILGEKLSYEKYRDEKPCEMFPHLMRNLICDADMAEEDMDARLAAPLAFPDSLLLQKAMDAQGPRHLPDPLIVPAWLGDRIAMEQIQKQLPESKKFLTYRNNIAGVTKSTESDFQVIDKYFHAMQVLMSGPEEGAPDFMRKEAWKLKTRQTVLASWARIRNTFALEAGNSYGIGALLDGNPGFVEPCPEFYQLLGQTAIHMVQLCRTDKDSNLSWRVSQWYDFAAECHQLEAMAHKELRGIEWNEVDRDFLGHYGPSILREKDPARAAAVASSGDKILIATAGPSRVLWVNYPWKGKNILCKGAVMTFYSFEADKPMTDTEWDAKLQAKPAPKPPEWLQPLLPEDK